MYLKTIIGYYNENGYRVVLNGEEIYHAGNSPWDSQEHYLSGEGLSLEAIKNLCLEISEDMAREFGVAFKGVEYESLEEEEEER